MAHTTKTPTSTHADIAVAATATTSAGSCLCPHEVVRLYSHTRSAHEAVPLDGDGFTVKLIPPPLALRAILLSRMLGVPTGAARFSLFGVSTSIVDAEENASGESALSKESSVPPSEPPNDRITAPLLPPPRGRPRDASVLGANSCWSCDGLFEVVALRMQAIEPREDKGSLQPGTGGSAAGIGSGNVVVGGVDNGNGRSVGGAVGGGGGLQGRTVVLEVAEGGRGVEVEALDDGRGVADGGRGVLDRERGAGLGAAERELIELLRPPPAERGRPRVMT